MNALELYFRLAFAIALLLAPGWCLARALGVRSVSATLAWSLTLLFGALVVTFLLISSLTTAIALFAVAGFAALAALLARRRGPSGRLCGGCGPRARSGAPRRAWCVSPQDTEDPTRCSPNPSRPRGISSCRRLLRSRSRPFGRRRFRVTSPLPRLGSRLP